MPIRNVKFLPPTPTTPEGYRDYRRKILSYRVWVEHEAQWRQDIQAREIVRCSQDPVYQAAVYGTIFEARPQEEHGENQDGSGYLPFIPYPFQIDAMDWFEQVLHGRGSRADGLGVKTRSMGLSNIAMFWAAWHWMWDDTFQARLLSRNQDLVDLLGDPDSLFWKLDTYLKGLPKWLFDAATGGRFRWEGHVKHRKKLWLKNPRTGNTIKGESTTSNAVRGGRATVAIIDEAAFVPNLGSIWAGLRGSVPHRIAISTVSLDEGYDFYNLHHGKDGYTRPSVLEIPWHLHPYHDRDWLKHEMERDNPEAIQREVLMNYWAGGSNWCYPEAQKIEVGDYPYKPYAGPLTVAIDDGFDNEGAAVLIQYDVRTGRHRVIAACVEAGKPADWWGSVLTGQLRSDFAYEEQARRFAMLMRMLPGVTFVGDAHVTQTNNVTGSSFQEHLATYWNVHIISTFGPHGQWTKKERIDKLSGFLPLLDVNDTESATYVLEALKRNRFKKRKSNHTESSESRSDIHDWTTHPVSALEYYFLNFVTFGSVYTGNTPKWSGKDNE